MKLYGRALALALLFPHRAQASSALKGIPNTPRSSRKLSFMTATPKHNSVAPKKFPFAHHLNGHRFLDEEQNRCDSAFMSCMPDETCFKCFDSLRDDNIDWADVDPYTPCNDVLELLENNGRCQDLKKNSAAKDAFCNTFNGCVVWDDEDEGFDEEDEEYLDCEKLTECNWDGMHISFVGDGLCHDYGCYNTQVCGFDGGDCCKDTCNGMAGVCGQDEYFCRDPKSDNCDNMLSWQCAEDQTFDDDDEPEWLDCAIDETMVIVHKYDSWGDGWDSTVLKLALEGKEVYSGTLNDGAEGRDSVCLKKGCYDATANGGVWGNEVSWEVHTQMGGPPLAFGGAPAKCKFSVKGDVCENSCNGLKSDVQIIDEDRKSYEQLSSCISESCMIPFGICKDDPDCAPCLNDDTGPFCRTVNNYNSLVDCSMCNCLDETPPFCAERNGPGGRRPGGPPKDEHGGRGSSQSGGQTWHEGKGGKDGIWSAKTSNAGACNPEETITGGHAVMQYSQCSDVDKVAALITNWDEDNFGPLDDFEECAHTFNNEKNHGGKQALDCMRLLSSIPNMALGNRADISSIAEGVYKRGEQFCDCASASNELAPSCDSFIHFKVLLHETLDACRALDEIDCAAWAQFHQPCKDTMTEKFNVIDFGKLEQCEFIEQGCGSTGAFPAFRRLDCGSEITKTSWDFYIEYSRGCLRSSSSSSSTTSSSSSSSSTTMHKYTTPPTVSSASSSSSTASQPTTSHEEKNTVSAPASSPKTTKYVPYSESELHEEKKKKKHGFLTFILVASVICVAVVVYRRRAQSSFDYQRYRRQRNYANDQNELYSGLTGGNTGSSFEPPTLPPTPSADFD